MNTDISFLDWVHSDLLLADAWARIGRQNESIRDDCIDRQEAIYKRLEELLKEQERKP